MSSRRKPPSIPRPSASVLLISPLNEILLLHRVRSSNSFAAAHVFPGGNLSTTQDGEIPPAETPARHEDGPAYRLAAIRECFEESGILLARRKDSAALLELDDESTAKGRVAVHNDEVRFTEWLDSHGGVPDTGTFVPLFHPTLPFSPPGQTNPLEENLIPFTRWITPTWTPIRFTTQMYLYLLPLPLPHPSSPNANLTPKPTPDGGLEHSSARFLPASTWLSLARNGEITLYPPQYFLLHLLAEHLSSDDARSTLPADHASQRAALRTFLNTSHPSWSRKCISPRVLRYLPGGEEAVLGLDRAGHELEGTERGGVGEWALVVRFGKKGEGVRVLKVGKREELLGKEGFEEETERREGKL
ncbi:MAG: hypothetical protein M1833_002158 [Piccolia ochrophora]|nr:MAG: hypothetical protein M1833_002158 [Piccolia ochrophora]